MAKSKEEKKAKEKEKLEKKAKEKAEKQKLKEKSKNESKKQSPSSEATKSDQQQEQQQEQQQSQPDGQSSEAATVTTKNVTTKNATTKSVTNGHSVKETSFDLPPHTPSYVGISCAILGYGLYNKYTGAPGPSLDVSPQKPEETNQPSDEVDSTGPVTRMINQFERLKKEQEAKAAAEFNLNRPTELVPIHGDLRPLSPPHEKPAKKFPAVVIPDSKNRPDEKTLQEKVEKHVQNQIVREEFRTPSPIVGEKRVVEERKMNDVSCVVEERKMNDVSRIVEEKKMNDVSCIVEEKKMTDASRIVEEKKMTVVQEQKSVETKVVEEPVEKNTNVFHTREERRNDDTGMETHVQQSVVEKSRSVVHDEIQQESIVSGRRMEQVDEIQQESAVSGRGMEQIEVEQIEVEQIAVMEQIVVSEDEDVSLVISESKSDPDQQVHAATASPVYKSDPDQQVHAATASPVFEDRSESDTGSVRIHQTPEPGESHDQHSFEAFVQQQESPSPLLVTQSPEQEIMKQEIVKQEIMKEGIMKEGIMKEGIMKEGIMKEEFPESAQILEQNEEEVVEDELSTQVQVSDSNEEALRGAAIGSTSSRKTSIESGGSSEVLVRDGRWFLSQYDLVCDEVGRKITQAESDLESCSNQMNEDVEGRVRAGIGKASLLITSKLKQFRDLCIKNIENSMTDGCETKIEDLEGFWEMVSFQIEDVHHTFDEIDHMRRNNWTVVPDLVSQRQEILAPKSKPRTKKSTSSVTAEDEEAAVAREEARKARLREAKRIQAERLAAEAQDNDVLIFAPPTTVEQIVGITTTSTPSPVPSDPVVSKETTTTVSQGLIEIESSTVISSSDSGENPSQPSQESEAVLVDLLS